jgi:hypothetical protein
MNEPAKVLLGLVVRLAWLVFLVILIIGLLSGANPVIAAVRSMAAFVAFALLGWAAARVFTLPAEGSAAGADSASPEPPASRSQAPVPGNGPAEAARGAGVPSSQRAQPHSTT